MKQVAIVGGGPGRKQAPWKDPSWEIWTLNEAAGKTKQRSEVVIQMHDPGIYKSPFNQTDPLHWEWLRQIHNIRIFMQKKDPEVPDSLEYPLEEICQEFLSKAYVKSHNDRDWTQIRLFTFSGTFAIALALYEHYTNIRTYGIDLIHTEEYRYQRESFAFWCGIAAGRGATLEVVGAEDIFKRPLYGYETFKEMRNMNFSIEERITMHDMVLPREADMVSMRIIRDFKKLLEFTDEEIEQYQIRAIGPKQIDPFDPEFVNNSEFLQYRWSAEGNEYQKDIEIGEHIRKVSQEAFKGFSEKGKFTEKLLALYDKFNYE